MFIELIIELRLRGLTQTTLQKCTLTSHFSFGSILLQIPFWDHGRKKTRRMPGWVLSSVSFVSGKKWGAEMHPAFCIHGECTSQHCSRKVQEMVCAWEMRFCHLPVAMSQADLSLIGAYDIYSSGAAGGKLYFVNDNPLHFDTGKMHWAKMQRTHLQEHHLEGRYINSLQQLTMSCVVLHENCNKVERLYELC